MDPDGDEGAGHYFDVSPTTTSATRQVTIGLVDPPLLMATDRGVFSHGRLDAGTEFLLRQAPPPRPSGVLLDLGCGSGALALTMARRAPAAHVIAIDVNERARALCQQNAMANGVGNVEVLAPSEVDPSMRFDVIWSNPPIRVGKPALHALLLRWLERLASDGTAILVVHKHLGSDSLQRWLTEQGWPTARLASSRGYRLLCVERR